MWVCSGSQLRLICPISSINQTNPREHQGLQPQPLLLLWEARNHLWEPQTSDLCMQQGGSHHSLQHPANCSIWNSCIPSLLFPPQLLLRDFILWARDFILLESRAPLRAWPCLRPSTHLVSHPSSQLLFLYAPRACRAAPPHSWITIHPVPDKSHFGNCPFLSLLNHRPQLYQNTARIFCSAWPARRHRERKAPEK